jgi:hypothetical protein
MRAREVVKVGGGEPPVEGGRGGVVAPLEGSERASMALVGGDCGISRPPVPPVVIVVRLVSATRRTTEL